MLSTGDVLSDRYRLESLVAGGGMGEVWRATDLALSRTVAVKVLRPALLTDPSFEARFRAEARTMAALNHSHVANVYDVGRADSVPYLVMAYVDGRPLSERIADEGRLPAGEVVSIVAQAADALDAAHRLGIVHRDVKPANLLISADGTVTLVDFGIARSQAATTGLTTGHNVLGTALYMAPEQASAGTVGPAVDQYALGAVAYHALAGTPPFPGGSGVEIAYRHVYEQPPPLPDDVPPAVRAVVERAMAKDPADRYPSAADLAAAARAAPLVAPLMAAGVPAGVDGLADTAPLPAPVPTRGRRPRTSLLVAGVLVLLLGLATLIALASGDRPAGTGTVPPPATSTAPGPSHSPTHRTVTGTRPSASRPTTPVPSSAAASGSASPPVPSRPPSTAPAGSPSGTPTGPPSASPVPSGAASGGTG